MRALLTASAFALVFAAPASAYVPPSQYVVKKMVARHSGFKGLKIRSLVVGLNGKDPSGVQFQQITTVDLGKRVLRSRAFDDTGKELYVVERSLRVDAPHPVVDTLMFETRMDFMSQALKSAGLPIRSDSELAAMADEEERRKAESAWIERVGTAMVWVYSEERKAPSKPQLWIEKDTFLPLRLVSKREGDLADIRFESYRFYREFPYPRQITLALGTDIGDRVLRDDLQELVVNPELAAEFKQRVQPGYTELGNSASSAVRDLITKYYQFLR